MVLQAARANLPWILLKMRSQVRLSQGDGSGPVLEVLLGEGRLLRAFVDARTHRVAGAESVMSFGRMKMRFKTQYTDFRKIDGVFFPFHEENYASGTHTATTKVQTIQLNPPANRLKLPAS
jgi:hypothetical protein